MKSDAKNCNVVVPVVGFVTIGIERQEGINPVVTASAELNKMLGELDWQLVIGTRSGRRVVLCVDPLAESSGSVASDGEISPQEASLARVRTRRSRVKQ